MSTRRIPKVYNALLTQSGTGDPCAIVLENTLLPNGTDIVWTRAGTGEYVGTLVGAFKNNKTFATILPPIGGQANVDLDNLVTDDTIGIHTTLQSSSPIDSILNDSPILIKVYL